jgi:TolB-like protein/Tfp pilus assembly protein PilF
VPTTDRVFPRKKTEMPILKKPYPILKTIGILAFIAAVLIAGFLFIQQYSRKKETEISPSRKISWTNAIAVLPFEDLSLQRDQEHFCDAMTEAIITKLTSIEELRVVPYQSTSRYKGTNKTLREISKELDVFTILVPKLKKEGDTIRVSAQLIDSREDSIIEAYTYEEELFSVFEVEDRISKSIAEALKVRLGEDMLRAIKKREPSDIKAYEFYAKGNYFERKFRKTENPEDVKNALVNYNEALALDPNYALAYWGKGYAYEALYVYQGSSEYLDLALKNFNKSYELDPNLPEANIGLVWVYFYKEDFENAIHFCKRAIQLAPNNPEVNYNVGSYLRSIGLYRKALDFYTRSIELDPLDLNYRRQCASCYSYLGDYEQAIILIKEGLELEPYNLESRLYLARQYIWVGSLDDAQPEIDKVKKQNPDLPNIRYTEALIYAANGEKDKALAIIDGIDACYFSYLISSVYAALGMNVEAIKNIEIAIAKGFYEVKTYMHVYPFLINHLFFKKLHDDPSFQQILLKEKKKYEEKLRVYEEVYSTK